MKLLTLLTIVSLSSCTPVPYMVVQHVFEDRQEALCRDPKGFEIWTDINEGCELRTGDTLLHIGNFNYYNINAWKH